MRPEETPVPSQPPSAARGHEPDASGPQDVPSTGDAAVDEVLASVATLDERPVDEHVAVFELAHDRLRRALDANPDS
jgi:hypothetical protein